MNSLAERYGLSTDREGFNSFGESESLQDKTKQILEQYFDTDVLIEDTSDNLVVEIQTDKFHDAPSGVVGSQSSPLKYEEFENRFYLQYEGWRRANGKGYTRTRISPQKFKEIAQEVQKMNDIDTSQVKDKVKDNKKNILIGAAGLAAGYLVIR